MTDGTDTARDGEVIEATQESLLQSLRNWRVGGFLLLVLLGFAVPYVPEQQFMAFLGAQIFIFAIVALAYNVLLGYTGLLSFGHAAFFGTGAYTVGLMLKYTGVQGFLPLLAAGIVAAFVISAVIGFVSVRHTGVYYALLMLALAQMLYLIVKKNYQITGGTDGIAITPPTFLGVDYAQVIGYNLYLEFILYFTVLATFVIVTVLLYLFMRSPFGLTLRTIRDSPDRAEAIGIPVKRYRWYASIISGTFTGVGGVLYAFVVGRIVPASTLFWSVSGEFAFITVLGGPTTFLGPAVGAGVFVLLRNYILQNAPQVWHFVLGAVLYLVVVLMPHGIYGGLRNVVSDVRTDGVSSVIRQRLAAWWRSITGSRIATEGGEQ